MRKPFKARTTTTKQKRQAFLAAILFAASPMWTGSTSSADDFFARPPLPIGTSVHAPAGVADVRVNPFCLPTKKESADPIRLASGTKSETATEGTRMQLQAIGEAIGLHEIGHGPIAKTDMPAIRVSMPPASQVQSNPLVDRILNGPTRKPLPAGDSMQTGLVAPVASPPVGQTTTPTSKPTHPPEPTVVDQQNSSIVLLPRMQPQPDASEVGESAADSKPETVVASESVAVAETSPKQAEIVAEMPEDTEPIFFSFSDAGSSDDVDDSPAESVQNNPPATEPSEFANALASEMPAGSANPDSEKYTGVERSDSQTLPSEASQTLASEASQAGPVGLNVTTEAKPMHGVGGIQHNEFVDELKRFADQINSASDDADDRIARHEPVANEVISKPEASLHSRRYRPPVAVHPVPIEFDASENNQADLASNSVVTSAPVVSEESAPVVSEETEASDSNATTLHMDLAQVRSLTLGAELQSVRIADKSVCQAFAAGPNKLKLIGTGNGTTRLVVYAKPVPGQSEPRVRSFDVHVKEASKINTESTEVRTEILNQTIQQTFPESDVVVRRSGNELVVMGRCGSEAVAKKIVRLVRRTCLVPVKDQLRVR